MVDVRGLPLGAGGDEFLTPATEQTADLSDVLAQERGHDVQIPVHIQHMPGGIGVHLPPPLQMVMLDQYGEFVVAERGPRLVDGPGKVTPVVTRRGIGVLAAVEPAPGVIVEHC